MGPARTLAGCLLAICAAACIVGIETESHVSALAVLGAGVYVLCWHVAVVEDVRRGRR